MLEDKREIAVTSRCWSRKEVVVNLVLSVKPKEGLLPGPVLDRVEEAMETWFDGTMLGKSVLLAQIGQRIFRWTGWENS